MRKLMLFVLGFGAACAFCAYAWICDGLIAPAVGFAVLSIALAVASRWGRGLRPAAIILIGICAGLLWFQTYSTVYLSATTNLDDAIADVTARCTDYSYETHYGTAVEGMLRLDGKPYRAKFYVNGHVEMEPGDVLTGPFEFRVTTPDGSDEPTTHQGKGIFLLAYQEEDAQLLKLAQPPRWSKIARLEHELLNILESSSRYLGDRA